YGELDPEPQLIAVLVGPDPTHGGACVSRDHTETPTGLRTSRPMSRLNCFPRNTTDSAARTTLALSAPTSVNTRPPAVSRRPSSPTRVPAWNGMTPSGKSSSPEIGSPGSGASGYPRAATTTPYVRPSRHC